MAQSRLILPVQRVDNFDYPSNQLKILGAKMSKQPKAMIGLFKIFYVYFNSHINKTFIDT